MKILARLLIFVLLSSTAYAGQQIIRNKTTKAVIRISETPIRADGKIPADLDPAVELVDIVDPPAQPAFNPATQKVVSTTSEQAGAVGFPIRLVYDWSVVALSQAELDAKAAESSAANERDQLKAVVSALRDGTGTTGERVARVEKACARLITDTFK